MKPTAMPDKPVPAAESPASKVFATTEVLGTILGHLDAIEFAQVQLAHPYCLHVTKNFPHLRRRFFLEQDPGVIDGGFQLNPIFEMVFRIFGCTWVRPSSFASTQKRHSCDIAQVAFISARTGKMNCTAPSGNRTSGHHRVKINGSSSSVCGHYYRRHYLPRQTMLFRFFQYATAIVTSFRTVTWMLRKGQALSGT